MEEVKMYWKNGFYDSEVDGGIEITYEYWRQLLNEQSNGKVITIDTSGMPITKDYVATEQEVIRSRILELKSLLISTDWINSKAADLSTTSRELYPEIWQQRIDARAEINELEKNLNMIENEVL